MCDSLLIGTDEIFDPFALGQFQITTGLHAGEYPATTVVGAASVATLADRRLNGPTVYVGYACPGSAPLPRRNDVGLRDLAPGEEAIAVIQRGPSGDPSAPEAACFPGQKAEMAMAAGYDAVLFVNHHGGEAANPHTPFCGSGAFTQPVVSGCTTHTAFHHLFDRPPDLSIPYAPAREPELGDLGHDVHEVATDPRPGTSLAYFSYYAAAGSTAATAAPEASTPARRRHPHG